MSTREYVYNLIDGLNEAQLKALADFITNFSEIKVDTLNVVRCKECKNRNTEGCPMTYWDGEILIDPTNDKDYCSYAEK